MPDAASLHDRHKHSRADAGLLGGCVVTASSLHQGQPDEGDRSETTPWLLDQEQWPEHPPVADRSEITARNVGPNCTNGNHSSCRWAGSPNNPAAVCDCPCHISSLHDQPKRSESLPPWSPETVERLNRWQASGQFHPYTCPDNHPGSRVLVAEAEGWRCPTCAYQQWWAHDFSVKAEPPEAAL